MKQTKDWDNAKSKKDAFLKTLKKTNTTTNDLIDWEKVNENKDALHSKLKEFDKLLGIKKNEIDDKIISLFKRNPKLISVIPYLIVIEKGENYFLTYEDNDWKENYLNFEITKQELTEDDVKPFLNFMKETNLINLFTDKKINSVSDYLLGIEVGRDTNSRKNRNGKRHNNFVKNHIEKIIKDKQGYELTKKKKYFEITTPTKKLYVKTSFYNTQGSKLETQITDFTNDTKKIDGELVWITDGRGWEQVKDEENFLNMFYENPNILNITMLQQGLLKGIILDEK